MKYYLATLFLLLFSAFLLAQEGFWSIDQGELLQQKFLSSGLSFPEKKLYNSASKNGLAHAVIRMAYGTATLINSRGLAIGVVSPYIIPDSIWGELKEGIWLAKPGQGIPLSGQEAQVFLHSNPVKNTFASAGTTSYENNTKLEVRPADVEQKNLYEHRYQKLGNITLVGVFRLPAQSDPEYHVGVFLQFQPISPNEVYPFIPRGVYDSINPAHLVLGFPEHSSIHRSSFELAYARDLSLCHQDLDRALGEYLTRSPFITQEDVFRWYENVSLLDQALAKRALREAEFRHQLSIHPQLKARYGTLLDSCRAVFKELRYYAAAQVYTKGIIYSPCSFFEAVRLFTMWRGRIGNSAHRLPTAEESQYFPEVFKRLPPTENELLLPELLQRYFTQLPSEHIAPYAIQQAVYANKDYGEMSQTLLLKSKFSQPEVIHDLLTQDFLIHIDDIAQDPAVQLVDSILQHYTKQVLPKMELAQRKAFQKAKELLHAMIEVLPDYPAYPEADQSLRLSYGSKLDVWAESPESYWLSNVHLLEDQFGSPLINSQGKLIGMMKDLGKSAEGNAYFYDQDKSRALIWRIDSIRQRIAAHPNGMYILAEWP